MNETFIFVRSFFFNASMVLEHSKLLRSSCRMDGGGVGLGGWGRTETCSSVCLRAQKDVTVKTGCSVHILSPEQRHRTCLKQP